MDPVPEEPRSYEVVKETVRSLDSFGCAVILIWRWTDSRDFEQTGIERGYQILFSLARVDADLFHWHQREVGATSIYSVSESD